MDFITAALLGTARQAPRGELAEELRRHGIPPPESPEQLLLAGAALSSRISRGGFRPGRLPGQPPGTAETDDRPSFGPEAADALRQMLSSRWANELIAEFFAVAAHKGLSPPTDCYPALMDWAADNLSAARDTEKVLGNRGRWLSAQNPDWSALFADERPDGDSADHGERLRRLRQIRPQEALNGIRLAWAAATAEQRLDLLSLLETGLSDADEAFLETALDDKSKPVRKKAARLLSLLPQSSFADRMFARCATLVRSSGSLLRGPGLSVELPSAPDEAGIRDGLDPKETRPKCSPAESLLVQMLSAVPPVRWSRALGLSEDKLVALALPQRHGRAIMLGWSIAASAHRDQPWLTALGRNWLVNAPTHEHWSEVPAKLLFSALDDTSHNALAMRFFRENAPNFVSDDQPVLELLYSPHRWNGELSRLVLDLLRKVIEKDSYVYHWGLKKLFRHAALHAAPDLAEEAAEGWPTEAYGWRHWKMEVDECLRALRLRRAIAREPSADQGAERSERK
jgi:hypothetical protein